MFANKDKRLLSDQLRKLKRQKSELEGAINALKKSAVLAQEILVKRNRRLAVELRTVKQENFRIKEELKGERCQKNKLAQELANAEVDLKFLKSLMAKGDMPKNKYKNHVNAREMPRECLQQDSELEVTENKKAAVRDLELESNIKQKKKPGLFMRGIQKLKGKISHRQSDHDSEMGPDGSYPCNDFTYLSCGPYRWHAVNNASSELQQALSPSTGQSESDRRDSHLLVPPLNSSPGTAPGWGSSGQHNLGSDAREFSHSHISFDSSCFNESSISLHSSSSRSSAISRMGDGQATRYGCVNSNNSENNSSKSNKADQTQLVKYLADFREHVHTSDSGPSSDSRSTEASPPSAYTVCPQSGTSGSSIPVLTGYSAVAFSKSIEDLSQPPQQLPLRPDWPRGMQRASSSDLLSYSDLQVTHHQGRCYTYTDV